MDCLFCSIARKEISAEIVYEDDHAVAFLDVHPRAPGHTLVIPKLHAPHLGELPDEAVGPFFLGVKRMVQRIEQTLHPDGFTFGINHGAVSGQTVGHLHFHIMPRWAHDGGGSMQSVVSAPSSESLDQIAARIRGS